MEVYIEYYWIPAYGVFSYCVGLILGMIIAGGNK